MIWRENHDALLRKLNAKLLTANQTAIQLSAEFAEDISRNAVIGRLHRLGISVGAGRRVAPPRPKRLARISRHRKRLPKPMLVQQEPRKLEKGEDPRSLSGCQYPLGDPKDTDFRYCLQGKWESSAYCQHHYSICYVPVTSRHERKGKATGFVVLKAGIAA